MVIEDFFTCENDEKPLDKLVNDGGLCGILRTVACIGDSLSSGEFEGTNDEGGKTYHDMYDYSWGQFMARMAGITVHNFSRGGMSAKWYLDSFADENGLWSLKLASKAYILALGVNDLNENSTLPVGTTDDVGSEDSVAPAGATFAGYYGKIIQKYKKIQPDAKFFFVTIPKSDWESESLSKKRDAHAKLLYEFTEYFSNSYVIDLRKYAPCYNAEFRKNFFLGGHMNAAGYIFTAKIMLSYIDYYIRHNMQDFKQIGFVGTPYENKADGKK